MTEREKLIEAMARALCARIYPSPDFKPEGSTWPSAWERSRCEFTYQATAALAAIEAMGAVVVPVEPTDRMIDATNDEYGWSADGIYGHYAAMLSASPYAKEPT
jgi:acyl-CoA synthetase (AMP-forming)/AMP-acid ligase II